MEGEGVRLCFLKGYINVHWSKWKEEEEIVSMKQKDGFKEGRKWYYRKGLMEYLFDMSAVKSSAIHSALCLFYIKVLNCFLKWWVLWYACTNVCWNDYISQERPFFPFISPFSVCPVYVRRGQDAALCGSGKYREGVEWNKSMGWYLALCYGY